MASIQRLQHVAVALVREADGAVLECNQRFRDLVLGGEQEHASVFEVLGLEPENLSAKEAAGAQACLEQRLLGSHSRPTWVGVHVCRDGPETVMLEVTDVTAQRRAREQHDWILESSLDGYFDWYIKEDYEYMSPQFWRMLGFEPGEKQPKPSAWQELVQEDDLEKLLAALQEHIDSRGETVFQQEVRFVRKDGSTAWVRCRGKVVEYDEYGGARRVVGTHTDITELKEQHAEERKLVKVIEEQNTRLQRRANEMHDLIYRANAPVVGFDLEGRITEWNARVAELVGTSEEEVLGLRLASQALCTPESVATIQRVLDNLRAGKPLNNLRISLWRKGVSNASEDSGDNGTVDLLVNSSPRFHAASAAPEGGYILGQDLTEVEHAKEDAIRSASKARAERDLNGYMAHEIRNPVFSAQAGMQSVAEYLDAQVQRGIPGAEAIAADASMVSTSLSYVFELLTSLLDLNKFLAGSLSYESHTVVDFGADVVAPVAAMLSRRCAEGVALTVDCEMGLAGCCDATRVKQVLLNLGGNALKFTDRGFVRIVVRASGEDELVVRIEDSGVGVPADTAGRLNEPFAQVPGHDQGNGVGLHLSRLVVERIGGALWLDPDYRSGLPGQPGASFCIRFPFESLASAHGTSTAPCANSTLNSVVSAGTACAQTKHASFEQQQMLGQSQSSGQVEESKEHELVETQHEQHQHEHQHEHEYEHQQETSDADAAAETAEPETLSRAGTDDSWLEEGGRRHLLLVDDDRLVRLMMARILRLALPEFEVHEAANAEQTLSQLEQGANFDVIFMDQHMSMSGGKMLGTDAVRAIRDMGADSLVVGLSGNELQDEFLAAGADLCWRKPMASKKVIRDRVLSALAARRSQSG